MRAQIKDENLGSSADRQRGPSVRIDTYDPDAN
jgi:hypothetical protein